MKLFKISNKEYFLKFTSQTIATLSAMDISLFTLTKDMEAMKVDNLYKAFHYGIKALRSDLDEEQTYNLIDAYYEEGGDLETFFTDVLGEYAKAMGLGKKFEELMQKNQTANE